MAMYDENDFCVLVWAMREMGGVITKFHVAYIGGIAKSYTLSIGGITK